jgi:hypothetical protein
VHRWLAFILVALGVLLASGCESFSRPQRPLPKTFAVRQLGGELVGAEQLKGKPWVIHLWVPG